MLRPLGVGVAVLLLSSLGLAGETVLTEAVSTRVRGGARSLVRVDPVEAQFVAGTGAAQGDFQGWTPVSAGKDGWFTGPEARGGYLAFTVKSSRDRAVFIEAPGSGTVYVDGRPRAGDPYGYGYMSLPALLKAGESHIVVQAGRGRLQVKIVDVAKPVSLDMRDATLPDVLPGEKAKQPASIVVRNATGKPAKVVLDGGAGRQAPTAVPAWSFRKVAVDLPAAKDGKVTVKLLVDGKSVDEAAVSLAVRKPGEAYKVTFVSDIDGSVQYYGVRPPLKEGPGQALFLSLHGASVEALGQAQAYGPHSWGYVICPTNRRPYGFDWEDVGRLDALEVLRHAKARFKTDPRMTYLTGHSMGGHGTWQVGGHYPGLFAAIAPSAGWISFNTYAGGYRYDMADPVQAMLARAGNTSDTTLLKRNYWQEGVYVLHGDADDNVPVTEARAMAKLLEGHPDFTLHEVPGVSHWYDTTPDAGADCVDWPGIFDMFAHHRLPATGDLRDIDFTTVSTGVSATCHWVTVLQQEHALMPSHVVLHVDLAAKRITGSVDNVARFAVDTSVWGGGEWTLELKGQKPVKFGPSDHLVTKPLPPRTFPAGAPQADEHWAAVPASSAQGEKSPARSGGFKSVFNHKVVFVYGTHGTASDNEWALATATFDAEQFAYRGNGSVLVVSDDEFTKSPLHGRNVLLFGRPGANTAWSSLVDAKSLSVAAGRVTVGTQEVSGDDLAVVGVLPRLGESETVVGFVCGSGMAGQRLCDRMPFFTSGAAFPDLVVVKASMLKDGPAGVLGGGFFSNRWDVDGGDWVWR
ncbi:MAG: prolyl oligopeptidase family serine peptidase [Fimbriimonadaceae bacterium]|nr:prolyl oligopeptidase family serine peptidase [Fimbriimonadaceae bacterium]